MTCSPMNKKSLAAENISVKVKRYFRLLFIFVGEVLNLGGLGSPLLQDFRNFAVRYFGERIVDKQYLDQLDRINKDFRCKAAHPYVLDSEIAERCRDQVRSCLNELILNYKGTASGSGS